MILTETNTRIRTQQYLPFFSIYKNLTVSFSYNVLRGFCCLCWINSKICWNFIVMLAFLCLNLAHIYTQLIVSALHSWLCSVFYKPSYLLKQLKDKRYLIFMCCQSRDLLIYLKTTRMILLESGAIDQCQCYGLFHVRQTVRGAMLCVLLNLCLK